VTGITRQGFIDDIASESRVVEPGIRAHVSYYVNVEVRLQGPRSREVQSTEHIYKSLLQLSPFVLSLTTIIMSGPLPNLPQPFTMNVYATGGGGGGGGGAGSGGNNDQDRGRGTTNPAHDYLIIRRREC
jgi:hypothetical protein